MPDGPAALSDLILAMAFFTMSIVIVMGGPSSVGSLDRCPGSNSALQAFQYAYTMHFALTSRSLPFSQRSS